MKINIFVIFFILVSLNIFCEDWEFIVTQDSPISAVIMSNTEYLYANTSIISDNRATYGIKENGERSPAFGFIHNPLRYPSINGKNVIPAHTQDLFDNNLLADENNILLSYCVDILKSENRETLLEYEPYYKNNRSYFEYAYEKFIYWYEEYDSYGAGFFVFNAVLFFGARYAVCQSLIVNNIEKTEYGYKVRCRESSSPNRIEVTVLASEWSLVQERQVFDLLIYIDGDYIDLYIDNTENKLGTFVSVSDEFVKQFNNLIKTNTCYLTNVQWPKRADGSMDYSFPIPNTPKEEKQSELIELSADSSATENQLAAQNSAKASVMPLWARLAVICGAAAVAGAVVFVVKRRK